MPRPYGPLDPATLAKIRTARAGKPWGFALWPQCKRTAVAGMGRVCASWEPNPGHWTKAQATAMSAKAVAAKRAKREAAGG
jgi:hypothetical protein